LLVAGVFPFLLGSAIAYHDTGSMDWFIFSCALVGVLSVLGAVEAFNEYFDSRIGTDRVFSPDSSPPVPRSVFWVGLGCFALALTIALYLSFHRTFGIMWFAVAGFIAAAFYVMPPIQWAYRGLGELCISLSYGPLMTLGGYYVQTARLDVRALPPSFVACLLVFALVLATEIPDYYQDWLVGKRNIVVRLGRKNAVLLYASVLCAFLATVLIGGATGALPRSSLVILALVVPLWRSIRTAEKHYDFPSEFIGAIRGTVFVYVASLSTLSLSYLLE
jgi:1,4-dihydroxy-2-naphthoate octaprenyltransferase